MPGRPRSDLPSGFCGYTMDSGDFWRLVFPAVWQITTWKENMTWISNTQAMLPSKRRRLGVDSPTGFTDRAAAWVLEAFRGLGFEARLTTKGGVLIDLGGQNGMTPCCWRPIPIPWGPWWRR